MKDLKFLSIPEIQSSPVWQKELERINYKLAIAYYAEYYQDKFKDHSFLIVLNDELIGYCIAMQIEATLCFPAEGIKVIFFGANNVRLSKIFAAIVEHLENIAQQNGCTEIIIKNELTTGQLSGLGEAIFNANFDSRLTFEMLVDVNDFDEAKYYAGIRKSYKSLINWGKRELDISIINKDALSYDKFMEFKQFHKKIAGRQTRTDASWDIQYQMVEQGFGELILANYQGNLVAGSLFIDQFEMTVYFTGVYERELFEYGISHYMLYHGIQRMHERGKSKVMTLGNFDTDITDRKLYNIQFFKKGFSNNFAPTILWRKKIGAA